jgi:predicted RNA-binding protein with PIN domain
MSSIERGIEKKVKTIQEKRPVSKIKMSAEMAEIFEKWRRGQK